MAGNIYIEAEIAVAGLPLPVMHLYLVHRDDDGAEYVLRSGPPRFAQLLSGDMRVEVNRPIQDSADSRGGRTPEDWRSTELVFDGQTTDEVWALMVRYARMIDDADIPYGALGTNSNAFMGALIEAAGGAPRAMLPRGVERDEAIGYGSRGEILRKAPPPPDGTVWGADWADTIVGIQVGETIQALGGRDVVRDGRGDDLVWGGGGSDQLLGEAGADVLRGGRGSDMLVGGAGADRLDGGLRADRLDGGPGDDMLRGRAGADVFVFAAPGVDRVLDFENGRDTIEISAPGVRGMTDLEVASFGSGDQHVRISFSQAAVELRDVELALIGRESFSFAGDFV